MRLTLVLFLIIANSFTGYSQTTIQPLEDGYESHPLNGTYYKDLNNVFNDFEGTWLYEDGEHSLKIVLQKEEMFENRGYYVDLIMGEFEYKKHGSLIMSTLSDLNNQSIAPNLRAAYGRNIYNNCSYMPVSDCVEGEKRVDLILRDIIEDKIYYSLVLHKRLNGNNESISMYINSESKQATFTEGEIIPQATISLQGEYIFLKQ